MKPTTPTLPQEVWSLIAERMTHKDWAKTCGTCQATFRLQLTRVSAAPSNLEELRWLAKHCPSAEIIRWHMAAGNMEAELQTIQACSPAASFHSVRQLWVSGDHSKLTQWTFWVLSNARNLQLLNLESISLPLLPTMCQLKHLMLTLKGEQKLNEEFCTRIGQLKRLETLAIEYRDKNWYNWEYNREDYIAEMAAMDLRACPQLSAVSFEYMYIAPAALDLPPGCTTHISYDADVLMHSPSWPHASSCIIHASCSIADKALPQLLRQPHQNLTSVQIDLDYHADHLDFSTPFPHLQCLSVSAIEVESLTIPETLKSLTLFLYCAPESVHIGSPGELANSLNSLYVTYHHNYNSTGVTALLEAMGSLEKECTITKPDEDPNGLQAAVYGEQEKHTCSRQACWSCLLSEGKLDPMLNPYYEVPGYMRSP